MNVGAPPTSVRERLAPVYARHVPELEEQSILFSGHDTVLAAAAAFDASGRFEPARVRRFPWTQRYTTALWLDYISTHSDHQALPPARLAALRDAAGAALDALGGGFEMPFETVLVDARRA